MKFSALLLYYIVCIGGMRVLKADLCKDAGKGINNVKNTWYIETEGKTGIKRQIIEPHKCQPCKYYIRLIDVHRYKYQTDAFRSSMLPKHVCIRI